jgi:hypothetical protein
VKGTPSNRVWRKLSIDRSNGVKTARGSARNVCTVYSLLILRAPLTKYASITRPFEVKNKIVVVYFVRPPITAIRPKQSLRSIVIFDDGVVGAAREDNPFKSHFWDRTAPQAASGFITNRRAARNEGAGWGRRGGCGTKVQYRRNLIRATLRATVRIAIAG